MKLPLAILITVAGSALATTAAEARDGCGRGMERGPRGHCHVIGRGPDRFAGNDRAWVVGRFYEGRGYWDGRRWYQHRDRYRGGWRYR